jgi:hypothetical protein
MERSKLIVLATFNNPHDAHLLKARLEDHGIKAIVGNENSTAIMGATIAGPSSAFWIEVLILESDAQAALPIKDAYNSGTKETFEEIGEWVCDCGETVDAGFAVCWNCERSYSQVQ